VGQLEPHGIELMKGVLEEFVCFLQIARSATLAGVQFGKILHL
jgi:hypothetical protein